MTRRRMLGGAGLLLLSVTGCTTAPPPGGGPAPAPRPSATDRVEACARLVGYWVQQQVTPSSDWGLDYQEMGLSDGENEIMVALLPAARGLAAQHGPGAVGPAATAWARPGCRAYLARWPVSTEPSGVWPQ